MSDNPKKADPAEKQLDSKERRAPGWNAEQARNQLIQDSFGNRPGNKPAEKTPEPKSTSMLGSVADWITDTFSSSEEKKAEPKQPESKQDHFVGTKIETSKSDNNDQRLEKETSTKTNPAIGWVGEEPQQAEYKPQQQKENPAKGWVGEQPQQAEYKPQQQKENPAKGWVGEEPQQAEYKAPSSKTDGSSQAWPDETQHGRAAAYLAKSGEKVESASQKNDDRSCTEADSPKASLDGFPEFFRKQADKPAEQQMDPREEQRIEQRQMIQAASGGAQATPQPETPHPSSVEMWTKQPVPTTWDQIDSPYGHSSKSKHDGVAQQEISADARVSGNQYFDPGKKVEAHASAGISAQVGAEAHSGKPDLSAGSFGSLGRSELSGGISAKGEIGVAGKDHGSLEPGKGDFRGGERGAAQSNEIGGRRDSVSSDTGGKPFPSTDTTGGGASKNSQNVDLGGPRTSSSDRGTGENKFERSDQRATESVTSRSNNTTDSTRTPEGMAPRAAEQTLKVVPGDDQNGNRAGIKVESPSREIELPPQVRYSPENKEVTTARMVVSPEQQNISLNLARMSAESKTAEQSQSAKRAEGGGEKTFVPAPIALTDIKGVPIVRDFRPGETAGLQEFKSNADPSKIFMEGKLGIATARTTDIVAGVRSAETSSPTVNQRVIELGLSSVLGTRDGKVDQSIFSAKLGDVQNSARTIDMLLGSKAETGNAKGASDLAARDLIGRERPDTAVAARVVKSNINGLREDLIGNRLGAENASGRGERGGFEIVGATERIRAERGLRGERDDLTELRSLLDRTSKLGGGEKRYLTGVEIALAAAIAAVAVAKTRGEKDLAISQAELAAKQLRELIDDSDLSTPETDDSESQLTLPWQADNSAADRKRPEYMIAHNDTLLSIAEQFYNDTAVAWLIADINKDRVSEFNEDGKRIIEMRTRQAIELPLWSEVHEFLRHRSELIKTTEIVTIVSETEVDRELLDSFLSTVIGISAKGDGRLGEALHELSLSESATIPSAPGSLLGPLKGSPSQQSAQSALARKRSHDLPNIGVPAFAGAGTSATTALTVEGNQLTVLLSLGRKLLPSLASLKKAGANLQSYVSGRDWNHQGLDDRSE